jgi:hypothetical protein
MNDVINALRTTLSEEKCFVIYLTFVEDAEVNVNFVSCQINQSTNIWLRFNFSLLAYFRTLQQPDDLIAYKLTKCISIFPFKSSGKLAFGLMKFRYLFTFQYRRLLCHIKHFFIISDVILI